MQRHGRHGHRTTASSAPRRARAASRRADRVLTGRRHTDDAHRRARAGLAVTAVVALALLAPPLAHAHAFLIRSDPPAGARLASAPRTLILTFNERFVGSSARVGLRRANGSTVSLSRPAAHGRTIRQALPAGLRGALVVSWQVLSDDGHVTRGEFAFAVGTNAALPAVRASSGTTSTADVVASWLLFVGIALGLGGLASERLVWRTADGAQQSPLRIALAFAAAGAVVQLATTAGNRRGGGVFDGLTPSAFVDAVETRPGLLSAVAFACVALAAAVGVVTGRRLWAAAPLVGVVVALALRGHAGTSGKWWAVVSDGVHLGSAALWIGALAHLVLVLARTGRPGTVAAAARRYSRLALPTVILVLASGAGNAVAQLRRVGDLVDTGYGVVLDVKAGLVLVALALAGSARTFALRRGPSSRLALLRRLTGLELAALGAVAVAVAVLVNVAPPRTRAASISPSRTLPSGGGTVRPPPGPFVEALEARDLAVGMAAGPAGSRITLTFTVIDPEGGGAGGLRLGARLVGSRATGRPVEATACGAGCYRAEVAAAGAPRAVLVTLRGPARAPTALRFPLPERWPPVPAAAIARRATAAFRDLHSVSYEERLASGPKDVVDSTWTLAAPNRFSYRIRGGPAAVVIGPRRWDRDPGGPWRRSDTGSSLPQPEPVWEKAPRKAALLGTATVHGRRVWIVTFLEPALPAWFTLWVDRKTYLPLELRMTATAHFMHHVYSDFDTAPPVRPPARP